jgi:hypothetical protein
VSTAASVDPTEARCAKERGIVWVRPAAGRARAKCRNAVGQTTIVVLAMNDPDVIRVRRSLTEVGLFLPVE